MPLACESGTGSIQMYASGILKHFFVEFVKSEVGDVCFEEQIVINLDKGLSFQASLICHDILLKLICSFGHVNGGSGYVCVLPWV